MKKIVLNLKMYMQLDEIKKYIKNIESLCDGNNKVIIAPSYVHIPFFTNKYFDLCSQDVSLYLKGGYTKEVSASQLKELGVKYSLIGHSEVRNEFNDNNDIINKKIKNCFTEGIIPIVCIGETKNDKFLNKTEQVLRREILEIFKDLNKEDLSNVIIAYEPIWAIATGNIPTNKEIEKTILYIKNLFYSAYKINVDVLYGGSIDFKNIQSLNKIEICDGFLIGKSSVNNDSISQILSIINNS